jgi:hypothetical protein
MKFMLPPTLLSILIGCKHRASNGSETRDVFSQGPYGPSEVIYPIRDDSGVSFHYRKCTDGTVPTRNCNNGSEATPIPWEEYLASVPEEVFDKFDLNFHGSLLTKKLMKLWDLRDQGVG